MLRVVLLALCAGSALSSCGVTPDFCRREADGLRSAWTSVCDVDVCTQCKTCGFPSWHTSAELPLKEPHRPVTSNLTTLCRLGSVTEFQVPCIQNGKKVYFQIDVFKASGFEYNLYTTDGSPTGVVELFSVDNPETDEVFDCFVSESTDEATCHNSLISRGARVAPPLVYEPKMTITFGFKACDVPPTCGKLRLAFYISGGTCSNFRVADFDEKRVCREAAAALQGSLVRALLFFLAVVLLL